MPRTPSPPASPMEMCIRDSYAIVDEKGPDHNKVFVAEVTHEGKVLGQGSGKSKKEAEQNAANAALEKMKA